MVYRVEVTRKAFSDAEEVYLWLAERSSLKAAAQWYSGLFNAIATLDTFPTRYPLAPESKDLGREIRQLLYGKRHAVYRVLFEIRGDTVFVLRVWHGARDWLQAGDIQEEGGEDGAEE